MQENEGDRLMKAAVRTEVVHRGGVVVTVGMASRCHVSALSCLLVHRNHRQETLRPVDLSLLHSSSGQVVS